MNRKHGEGRISDQDWVRLRLWSQGYDVGWGTERMSVSPLIPPDQPDYIAGFMRGQKDRRDVEREQQY